MKTAHADTIDIKINPAISREQLYTFYQRNNICEEGYDIETATCVLDHSSLIVGALEGDQLVGFARALFDGREAAVMEFCIATEFQGENLKKSNGSLIEKDDSGLGKRLGKVFLDELVRMGANFITVYLVENLEEPFYESIGFEHNIGHKVHYLERRPYVVGPNTSNTGKTG